MKKSFFPRFLPFLFLLIYGLFLGFFQNGNWEQKVILERDNSFYLDNYVVNIDVRADRHIYVREEIYVRFMRPRASIIRDLPINYGLRYTDINVEGRNCKVTSSAGFLTVDVDASNLIQNMDDRTYIMTYTMIVPEISGACESLAFNLIGIGWPTHIDNATINLTLPAAPENYSFYVGNYSTKDRNKITYDINGNTINISMICPPKIVPV